MNALRRNQGGSKGQADIMHYACDDTDMDAPLDSGNHVNVIAQETRHKRMFI